MVSSYTPTFAATRDLKEAFYGALQSAIVEIYILCGFNGRVGSLRTKGDQWRKKVRGPFGLGEANDVRKELLNSLLLNDATICNTWFQKKSIYKQTWQHPQSNQWHCIDYSITKQKDCRWCLDVEVKHGAECHTNHQLVRGKLTMTRRWVESDQQKMHR